MEAIQRGTVVDRPRGGSLYGIYIVALLTSLVGNLAVRLGQRWGEVPPWLLVVVAIATVIPLGLAAIWFWRLLRQDLDEMIQRIVLEGMAFALVVYVPLAALYVNLRTAGVWTPRLDPPDILVTPALLVAIGIMVAWRRYR